MKIHDKTSLFQNLKDESGQAIWWFVLIMGLFLGMGGLVVDVAHGFFDGDEPKMANGLLDRLARGFRPKEFQA